ncbi:MAG TPA: IS110 family transposase [Acidobacteriaceae bacterium]
MSKVRFVGMDVHAERIAVAVAEPGGEVRSLGTIANRPESIRKMIGKLGPVGKLKCCYEAGPTGYVLYWQLTQMGVACEVIAPSLIPVKAGDRVKTDRRDAEKLARCYQKGDLTAVWVPDASHEALRDLVRAREAAKKDQLRHRHRLGKFLLRHGKRPAEAGPAWGRKYMDWIRVHAHFEEPALETTVRHYLHEVEHVAERIGKLEQAIDEAVQTASPQIKAVIDALQSLRGVALTTAATVVCELGSLSRFESPRQLMAYSGLVPREHSSGNRVHRGAITKTGNAHLRRVLVESAWSYQHRPSVQGRLLRRQKSLVLDDEVKRISWKAQERLCKRFTALSAKGKARGQVITAVARELLGFMWAIARQAESKTAA